MHTNYKIKRDEIIKDALNYEPIERKNLINCINVGVILSVGLTLVLFVGGLFITDTLLDHPRREASFMTAIVSIAGVVISLIFALLGATQLLKRLSKAFGVNLLNGDKIADILQAHHYENILMVSKTYPELNPKINSLLQYRNNELLIVDYLGLNIRDLIALEKEAQCEKEKNDFVNTGKVNA